MVILGDVSDKVKSMLKDIVVHIPVERPAEPVVDCALSVASMFGAHLDGVVCTYQSINPAMAVGPTAAAFALPTEYNTDPQLANSRLDQFAASAARAGITAGRGCVSDTPFLANRALAEVSRLYDLTIVAQADSSRPTHDGALPEALLFGSGRQMLLVPYIHSGPLKTGRALICWDGSSQAARAVHDALPFLKRAQVIDVVSVNGTAPRESSAATLIDHLTRRGLSANLQQAVAEPSNIHNVVLSLAADLGSDFLVMGGYGHSRLREIILGGMTRGMLESLTIPALISH
jgi:nucleotide-binding universal stress UspA family protein